MSRTLGQSVPPSLMLLFFQAIGIPKSTGFTLWCAGTYSGYALATGKRMPFRFPRRQGFTGPNITPPQSTQRGIFRASLNIYNDQLSYAPFGTAYGPQGHNMWFEKAAGFAMWQVNYFIQTHIPYEKDAKPATWDPHYYLNIYAMSNGCWHGYAQTPRLEAGTYRVTLMPSWLHQAGEFAGYISAVRVFEGYDPPPAYDRGPIGDWDPDEDWIYGNRNDWAATPGAAWSRYLNDSLHTYRDLVLDVNMRVMVQFEDRESWPVLTITGALQIKIEKIA